MNLISALILSFHDNFIIRPYTSFPLISAILALQCFIIFLSMRCSRTNIKIFILSNIWLFWSVSMNLSTAYEPEIQIKAAIETMTLQLIIISFIHIFLAQDFRKFIFYFVAINAPFVLYQIINGYAVSGAHSNRNTFAILLSYLLLISIYHNAKHKTFKYFAIISILASRSSKGIIGLLFYVFMDQKRKYKVIFFIFPILLLAAWLSGSLDQGVYKFSQLTTPIETLNPDNVRNDSALIRLYLIGQSLSLFADSPIYGYGVNQAQYFIELPSAFEGRLSSLNTQNNFSEVLVSGGIVGLVLYYAPLLIIVANQLLFKTEYYSLIISLTFCKIFFDLFSKSYNVPATILVYTLVLYLHFDGRKKNP